MKLLLDTHIVLWLLRDARELKAGARSMIGHAEAVFVSAASWWEVAIKVAAGKLPVEPERLQAQALAAHGLPPLHRDPFDRMLVAQAISEPLHLLTHDAALAAYSDLVTVV